MNLRHRSRHKPKERLINFIQKPIRQQNRYFNILEHPQSLLELSLSHESHKSVLLPSRLKNIVIESQIHLILKQPETALDHVLFTSFIWFI